MSVPDTMRMDLADPRIYDRITLDRQQAQQLVNEVDSLREQAKAYQHEAESYESAIRDAGFDLQAAERDLQKACKQRDQLLAQLDQLWEAVKNYDQNWRAGSKLLDVMNNTRDMITNMKTT